MTAYDSIERGAADECEPLRGRRSRTFTLTQLLVACGAVCVCAIGATTVVNTHLANFDDDSALANFDDNSALANFDDGSAFDDDSAFDGDSALANFDDGSALDDELALADSDDDFDDDDSSEGAQLGRHEKSPREKCYYEEYQRFSETMRKVDSYANDRKKKCFTTTKQCRDKCWKAHQGTQCSRNAGCRKCHDQCFKADKKCHDDNKKRYNTDAGKVRSGFYTKRKGCAKLSNARPKPPPNPSPPPSPPPRHPGTPAIRQNDLWQVSFEYN